MAFHTVNRTLVCGALDESAPPDLMVKCKSAGRCPQKDIRLCGGLHIKNCPAYEFIYTKLNKDERTKLFALLSLIDRHNGRPFNREKFKDLGMDYKGKKMLEIKSGQLRIGCVLDSGKLVMTNAFKKKQDAWPKSEIIRFKNIYDDYLEVNKRLLA